MHKWCCMHTIRHHLYKMTLPLCLLAYAQGALAQDVVTLGELQAKSSITLTRAEAQTLLSGAKMSRSNEKGNQHLWTNDASGDITISSDNRGTSGRGSSARGKWSVAEDGRFCMVVQWRKGDDEDTCRFILKTADDFYAASKLEPVSRTAYKLTITR